MTRDHVAEGEARVAEDVRVAARRAASVLRDGDDPRAAAEGHPRYLRGRIARAVAAIREEQEAR